MSSAVRDARVRATRLFEDELLLVVSPSHRLASRRSVPPTELRGERILVYSQADNNFVFRDVLAPAGVSPGQLAVVQLTEAVLELTKANLGVAILAGWAVRPHLDGGALCTVRIENAAVKRSWKAVVRASKATPVYISDFVRFLTATVAKPPKRRAEFEVVRSLKRAR
jgi:LysR family transcriptional regulator for metE and metH